MKTYTAKIFRGKFLFHLLDVSPFLVFGFLAANIISAIVENGKSAFYLFSILIAVILNLGMLFILRKVNRRLHVHIFDDRMELTYLPQLGIIPQKKITIPFSYVIEMTTGKFYYRTKTDYLTITLEGNERYRIIDWLPIFEMARDSSSSHTIRAILEAYKEYADRS